jgi:NAD(P)-dependent dehydrogenase (short-subunit alcohol dehydrogenase family)
VNPTFRLDDKVVVITGGSKGLGRAMALGFAEAGAHIVVASRKLEPCEVVADEVRALGRRALAVSCHVGEWAQCDALVDATIAEFGRVDILINSAGVLVPGGYLTMQIRHFDLSYRMRVRAPFVLSRLVLPHMIEQGWGHLIYISTPGEQPFVSGLTEELRDKNVAVNRLRIGKQIVTEGGNFFRGSKTEDLIGYHLNAEIMGDAAVIIASQEPRTFTGHVNTDEGYVLAEGGSLDRYPVVGE